MKFVLANLIQFVQSMKKLSKLFIVFCLYTIVFYLPKSVRASDDFETQYNVSYEISKNGEVEITQNLSVFNKKSSVFAKNYSLNISRMRIYDVKAFDKKGPLKIKISEENGVTTIKIDFNEQVIGEGREYKWTLTYKSKDIAHKIGQIWNVYIPKIEILEAVKAYDVKLVIPQDFGQKIFISPNPISTVENNSNSEYKFDKNGVKSEGISAAFGKNQILNFKLDYRLQNSSKFTTIQEIALPPDISYRQQVAFNSLSKKPLYTKIDKDGNVLAGYKVKPKNDLFISLIGSAKVYGKQIQPEFGGSFSDISNDYKIYTRKQKYWETDSKKIKETSSKLFDGKKNVSQNAQNIYKYVVTNLSYNFDAIKKENVIRYGAEKSLDKNGKWTCMEFTDLFIALSRAMGIPARELNGYAFTQENYTTPLSINLRGGDFLHSWPEYYDPNFGWVAVDPTWGSTSGLDYFTKMDTNHFVFVIRGLSSESPIPAGAYKTNMDEKQVDIEFSQAEKPENDFNEKIVLYKAPNFNIFKIIRGYKKYYVSNEGSTLIYAFDGKIQQLPPYGIKEIYIKKIDKTIRYENFNKEERFLNIIVTKGKPNIYKEVSTTKILALIFLALALYMIFYLSISHPKYLKRLYSRLCRLLQDLNQRSSRHLK